MRSFGCTLDGCGGGAMNPLYPCYHDNALLHPDHTTKMNSPPERGSAIDKKQYCLLL